MKNRLSDSLIRLDETDSTNRYALDLSKEKEGDFAVTAEMQTRGRGRMGRSFESPKGSGLYLTVLERRVLDPHLTPLVAVCTAKAIEKTTGLFCDIKWPNDIVFGGRKLCGILCERLGDAVAIGIGINLSQTEEDFGELKDIATSLRLCGEKADKEELLSALLSGLDEMLDTYADAGKRNEYLAYYRYHSNVIGKEIWLISGNKKTPALCTGINEDFELLVKYDDGKEGVISTGEISLRLR